MNGSRFKNVLERLMEDMTFKELTDTIEAWRGDIDELYYRTDTVSLTKTSYAKGVKTLQFIGLVNSYHRNNQYKIIIQFSNVNEEDNKLGYKKPCLTKNDVHIRCSCLDYTFRFQFSNKKVNALYGNPKKYKRKTLTRPPVNPDEVPGYCKHIYDFMGWLVDNDYVDYK
jgi:hypothetical protein